MKQLSISEIGTKLFLLSLVYVALVLPFHGPSVPLGIGIGFMFLFWLVEGQLKAKFRKLMGSPYLLLFIAVYFIYLFSFFYSSNKQLAGIDLGLKLSLLLCPIAIGTSTALGKPQVFTILKTFVVSSLVSALACLAYAFYQWHFLGENDFSYASLSLFIPVGYYAMYLAFACFLLAYDWVERVKRFSIFHFLALVFLSLMIVLLSARAQLLAYLLIMAGVGFYFFRQKFGWALAMVVMAGLFGLFSVGAYLNPGTRSRLELGWKEINTKTELQHKKNLLGIQVRFIIWQFGKEIIQENPIFGVGNGDTKDALMLKARVHEIPAIYQKELNFHSQYFQTAVATGLFGFCVFLLSLLLPLRHSIRQNMPIYTCFLLLFIISFFTESVLERQAGLVFFAFFNALLFIKPKATTT